MSDKPARLMWELRQPKTPEEQAAYDNFCFAIVNGISRSIEARKQGYKPGDTATAPAESSAPRSASTGD